MDSGSTSGSSGKISPTRMRSRTQSVSSDRPSTIGSGFGLPPLAVSPESCFIAPGAASRIITNDHDSHADAWYDRTGIEPAAEVAAISGSALQLVNGFLDQLLFNFLQLAKSTSLSALRPAIVEVLKPKLAEDAIGNAEEELRESLGDAAEDDDDHVEHHQGEEALSRHWDLDLAWRRTRLRCMVYSSLGDMEEEDEDLYMEEQNLELGTDEHISGIVSPAAAIFLTSVLEYMGELTLTVASQAVCHRVQTKTERELRQGTRSTSDPADRIIVGECDVERVALDRTLGRLWRGWKKRLRTPARDAAERPVPKPLSSPPSRQENRAPGPNTADLPHSGACGDAGEPRHSQEYSERRPVVRHVEAAETPLPVADNDADEIAFPSGAHHSGQGTDVDSDEEDEAPKRPMSLPLSHITMAGDPLVAATTASAPMRQSQSQAAVLSTKRRSSSVPTRRLSRLYPSRRGHTRTCGAESKASPALGAGDARGGTSGQESLCAGAVEEIAYRRAVVLTSKRVSTVGSTHSILSDDNGRRTSMHSARLIHIPAPSSPPCGSPDHSRAASMDKPCWDAHPVTSSAVPVPVPVTDVNVSTFETGALYQTRQPAKQCGRDEEAEAEASPDDAATRAAAGAGAGATERRKKGPPGRINTNAQTRVREQQGASTGGKAGGASLPAAPDGDGCSPPQGGFGARQVQVPTALSSASSAASRLKPVRTSDDGGGSSRSGSVARDFEELIQSNQTITYTLTPENMRDIESKSPVVTNSARSKNSTAQAPNLPKSSPPTRAESGPTAQLPSSHLPPASATSGRCMENNLKTCPPAATKLSGPVPRAPKTTTSSTSAAAPSSQTTGPTTDESKEHSYGALPKLSSPVSPGVSVREASRHTSSATSSSVTRPRYQPRDAAVDRKTDHSDLIDFIRQGPPTASTSHRIPRHIAPFRTTMDSDQLAWAVGGRAIDATIPDISDSVSSSNAIERTPSMHSSVNSKSALLRNMGAPNKMTSNMFGGGADDDATMPERKTRRVRDPYAVEFSDEEGDEKEAEQESDEAEALKAPPPKRQESLADFLRDYNPPPEPASSPPPRVPRKRVSAPGLMARFTRSVKDKHKHKDRAAQGPDAGHIPIHVNMPASHDRCGPVGGPPGAQRPLTCTTAGGTGRIAMKKFEPREAVPDKTQGQSMAGLAAFLRDSSPPPGNSPAVLDQQAGGGGIAKRFGRRKKSLAA